MLSYSTQRIVWPLACLHTASVIASHQLLWCTGCKGPKLRLRSFIFSCKTIYSLNLWTWRSASFQIKVPFFMDGNYFISFLNWLAILLLRLIWKNAFDSLDCSISDKLDLILFYVFYFFWKQGLLPKPCVAHSQHL